MRRTTFTALGALPLGVVTADNATAEWNSGAQVHRASTDIRL